ncbi:hypothetical protein ACHAXT_006158 [Thalassiosira profunda]
MGDAAAAAAPSAGKSSSLVDTVVRPLLCLLLAWLTFTQCRTLLAEAYNIRLHAINNFGYIIHEFDPYFNYRAATYLYDNGWAKFATWFDYKVWYPLGRPVGTTIYPGMQVTAVWLAKSWLPVWFGIKDWLGMAIPERVEAKDALEVSRQIAASPIGSRAMSAVASLMGSAGMKWQEMSLNDVCCLLPAWFGALATLTTGLMALECSADFGYGGGSRFGTALDQVPVIGYLIKTILRPTRNSLVGTLGLEDAAGRPHTTSSLQTASLFSFVATMFFMSIVPAHIMRSVGGGFDNESVAMFAMTLVFFSWTRSLRGIPEKRGVTIAEKDDKVGMHIREKQDLGFELSKETKAAAFFGALTGLAYFNMVAAWGGYVFVINLVGVHAGTLVLLGRHSSKLHAAYSAFYLVGTALATRVPVVGLTPLRSLEQLGPLLVFVGLQFVEFCERVRTRDNLSRGQVWKLRVKCFGLVGVALVGIAAVLWPTGFFGPISARVRGLFVKHVKTGNPLVDSVAEHQPAQQGAYDQYLQIVAKLSPLGFAMVAAGYSNDASSFLLVYGMAAYFFSHKMVRLILLTAPIASVLGGMLVGRVAGFCVEGVCGFSLDVWELFDNGEEEVAEEKPVAEKAKKSNGAKKDAKKKAAKSAENSETDTEASAPELPNLVFQLAVRVAWLVLSYYLYSGAQPHIRDFQEACQMMATQMSHPTILFHGQRNDGSKILVDDYREAYWWLRDNTPEDSRIMAWWDYGYQITAIANRTTIADGNTWNHEHIALLGRALTSPLKDGHRIARHLADYVLLWTGGGGDDLAKSPHLARIANSVYRHMCPGDPTCSRFSIPGGQPSPMMRESLLFRLHSNGIVPGVEVDKNRFKEVYKSQHGNVRIYRVLSVSKESKEWVLNNRQCDAPGSWYCPGQYPPGLQKVLQSKKDFKQLEDFNAQTEADDEYQKKYMEHLSDPEKARRRAQIREKKEREAMGDYGMPSSEPLTAEEIRDLNQRWEDSDATSAVYGLISHGDFDAFKDLVENAPMYAHVRSKDGRGPMWWAHEHNRPRMVKLLKSVGVSERLRDKDGITPLDLSDEL